MNQYPMKPLMDQMATHGRYGDSMLVHMNPAEVQGIAALSPTGRLTTNPVTGQPEAFLPFLAPIVGSMAGAAWLTPAIASGLGGSALAGIAAGALGSGIGAGLSTGLVTGDWDKAKMDFLGGAVTGGIGAVPGLGQTTELAKIPDATSALGAAKTNLADLTKVADTQKALIQAGGDLAPEALSATQGLVGGAEQSLAAAKEGVKGAWDKFDYFGAIADDPVLAAKDFAKAGFLVPKAISEGAKTAIDRERMEKAMYADVEAEREERLAEAQGNIQRGYVAAQPDAMRGPSEYRKHLSTYTEPYQYASQGGIVSLAEGGQVPDPLTQLWNESVAAGDLTPYYDRLRNLRQSGADWAAQNLGQGEEATPPEDAAPEAPTSGYRVDPTTGATVYFDDTRPSLARSDADPSNYVGRFSNPFGGGYMGGFGINNPGYKGVDPITIQANLRGRYAVDRPMGYMPGFEPEFRHFQSDLENIQVPSRQYAPQAAGPVMGTPYFGTMVDPAAYLDEIGRYYSDIGAYRPRIGAAEIALDEEEAVKEDVADEEVVDEDVVDEEVIDEEVVDEEVVDEEKEAPPPVGGISDIVVGNYQGGAKPQSKPKSYEDMVTFNPETGMWEGRHWDHDLGETLFSEAPEKNVEYDPEQMTLGPSQTQDFFDYNEKARQSVISQLKAYSEEQLMKKHAADSPWWDYYSETFGYVNPYTKELGTQTKKQKPKAKASEDAAKAKERERLAAIRRSAERQAQQTGRPTRGRMSVTGPSGETTYFSTGGQIPLGMDSPSGIAQADQAFVDGRGIAAVPTDFSQRGASMEPREKSLAEVPQQDVMVLAEALLRNDIPPQLKDSIIMDFQSKHGPRALEEARMVILSQGDPAVQTSGLVRGRGDGKSDSIMGSIGDQEGAIAVSDGEYIVGADVVSAAGNGSTEAGAEFFEELSDNLRRGTTGTTEQTRKINPREMI